MKRTTQNPKLGSAKHSARNPIYKNGESSSKISKYFSTNNTFKETATTSQNMFDSPYKKSLSEIKYEPLNDNLEKDFRTPKPIKVQNKRREEKSKKIIKQKPKVNSSKSKQKNSIFKTTRENFGLSDVNPDHLQMALALSKSTYAVEYPESSKEVEDSLPTFLTPEKIPKMKTTLERYGFRSDRAKLQGSKRETIEIPKKNKNSKFRFITPTLKIRTIEERQEIVASKISLILNSNTNISRESSNEAEEFNELYSESLQRFKGSRSVFAANDKYYVEEIIKSPNRYKCGCLLKNWDDIAGREKSPVRVIESSKECVITTITISSSEESKTDSQEENVGSNQNLFAEDSNRDCISPDLFESDNEAEYFPKSPESEEVSQSLLSPSKKQRLTVSSLQSGCFKSQNATPKSKIFETDTNKEVIKVTKVLFSEDEDTEELYLNSLKSKEDQIVDLTQSSSSMGISQFLNSADGCFAKDKDFVSNLTQNSPSNNQKGDKTNKLSKTKEPSSVNAKEDFIVDLTLSSSSEDSNIRSSVEVLKTGANNGEVSEDPNTIFEMSPLYLKNSIEVLEIDGHSKEDDVINIPETFSFSPKVDANVSLGSEDFKDSSAILNVTDYVNQILSQDHSKIENQDLHDCSNTETMNISINDLENAKDDGDLETNKQDDENEFISSQESYSQESIVLSDEELNYSSLHSKDSETNKYFYSISDDEVSPKSIENNAALMDVNEVYKVHSVLKKKYRNKEIATPVHNRVSELRGKTPLTKTSLSQEFLDDSFNDLLEDAEIIKSLENQANQKLDELSTELHQTDDKSTPEKCPKVLTTTKAASDGTPENNLIIKTKDVTPLANYDQMDTPGITTELQKFGLKPLKRQRGVKLLKYLYESTHPFVGPEEVEELSSDEDDKKRVTKRRKKSDKNKSRSVLTTSDDFRCDQECIEIMGDSLLENENLDDLIFERKFSVRSSSCRVPLQIIWHNFLSINVQIKESILLYEPLQLEVLHAMIKEQTGCKFHIQDLLTFLDRKCITFRTAQGSQRAKKKGKV